MRIATFFKFFFIISVVYIGTSQISHAVVECEKDNDALRSMPLSNVVFERKDGSIFEVQVRTASTNRARSAGFQYVCAETIAATPILFIFDKPVTPSFHMNNVVAGIDIAFISPDSMIDSIQKMKPYVLIMVKKPLYSSTGPVIAALEAHPDFFKINKIDLDAKVSWHLLEN